MYGFIPRLRNRSHCIRLNRRQKKMPENLPMISTETRRNIICCHAKWHSIQIRRGRIQCHSARCLFRNGMSRPSRDPRCKKKQTFQVHDLLLKGRRSMQGKNQNAPDARRFTLLVPVQGPKRLRSQRIKKTFSVHGTRALRSNEQNETTVFLWIIHY